MAEKILESLEIKTGENTSDKYIIPYNALANRPDLSVYAKLAGGNTFSGVQTVNAPANISGSEQATAKYKTSNGGSITFGKEGGNSGTMIRLDQNDGTCRLRFRSSSTAGAMVWEQPEQGANLYIDLGKQGADYRRITMPSSSGTLALTSQIPSAVTESTVSGWGFTKNKGTVTSVAVKMNGASKGTVTSSGTIDLGTVLTNASAFATSAQGTKADNAMPKSGGTFTGAVSSKSYYKSENADLRTSTTLSHIAVNVDNGRTNSHTAYMNGQINIKSASSSSEKTITIPDKAGTIALTSDIPTKTSQLTNDSGFTANKGTVTSVKINGVNKTPNAAGLVDLGTISGGGGGGTKTYSDYIYADDITTIFENNEYGNAFIFAASDSGQGSRQIYSIYVGGVKTDILTTDPASDYVDQAVCINISRINDGTPYSFINVNVFYKNTLKTIHIDDISNSTIDLRYTDSENQTSSLYLNITKGTT